MKIAILTLFCLSHFVLFSFSHLVSTPFESAFFESKESGVISSDTVNVSNYGIVSNMGLCSVINQLIRSAPLSGRTIYFPSGIYVIDNKEGLILSHSNITLLGAPGKTTTFVPGKSNIWRLVQCSTSKPYLHDIRIRNIVFKCKNGHNYSKGAISLYGKRMVNFIIDSCTFLDASPDYILASDVANFEISNCTFTQTGEIQKGSFIYLSSGTDIKIKNNNIRGYYNGIYVAPKNTITNLLVSHNILDGAWYLSKANLGYHHKGAKYTNDALVDVKVDFKKYAYYDSNDITKWRLVRVFVQRGTGEGIMNGNNLFDSNSKFEDCGIIPGEVVEVGDTMGIIDSIISDRYLRIEYWFDKNTMNKVMSPRGLFNYSCRGIYLGRINKIETHSISVDCWHNLNGEVVMPEGGSNYEIIRQLPMYGLDIASGNVRGVIIKNKFLRNYGDQVSVYSGGMIIEGNYITDGQDMGITVYNRDNLGSIVRNNVVNRPGTCGIFVNGDSNRITNNLIIGPLPSVNLTLSHILAGIRIDAGNGNLIDSNTINLKGTKNGLNGGYGIVLEKNTVNTTEIKGNNFIGVINKKVKIWSKVNQNVEVR